MSKMSRKNNGNGCFRKLSKIDTIPEKWTGRKQFGNKPDGSPNIKAVYGNSEDECRKKMQEYESVYNKELQKIEVVVKKTKEKPIKEDSYSNELLKDFIQSWFKVQHKLDVKEHTYECDETTMRIRILPYPIAQYSLNKLNSDNLQEFINTLCFSPINERIPYSRGTVIKTYNLLSKALLFATRQHLIPHNPMASVFIPHEDIMPIKTKETEFLTVEETELMFKECIRKDKNDNYVYSRNGLIIIFVMYTGLRIGECLALTWKDFNRNTNSIFVHTNLTKVKNNEYRTTSKGSKSRTLSSLSSNRKTMKKITTPKSKSAVRVVPLSDRALFAIKEIERLNGTMATDYIFTTETGKSQNDRNLNRTLTHIKVHTNFSATKITNHVLRHSFGYYLLQKGVPISTISKLLGHARISTTLNIYLNHVTSNEAISAIEVFNN